MTNENKQKNLYNYLAPLFVSIIFLCSAIYLTVLETNLYKYCIPLCSVFFIVSFVSFYRTKDDLKEIDEKNRNTFYYRAVGIFLIAFMFFFLMTLLYVPFYHEGGQLFVWWFAPAVVLSLIGYLTSNYQLKKNPAQVK